MPKGPSKPLIEAFGRCPSKQTLFAKKNSPIDLNLQMKKAMKTSVTSSDIWDLGYRAVEVGPDRGTTSMSVLDP